METDYIKFKVKNPNARSNKRKAEIEHMRFLRKIEKYEVSFGVNLFDPSLALVDYIDIYLGYVDEVKYQIKELNKKFRVIYIDPYFFEKRYGPIESV